MQTTKSRILDHLKRSGGGPVNELAASLGLVKLTIRQHLALLSQLLGSDVRGSQLVSEGAECCRFVVQDDGSEPDTTKARERQVS